MKALLLVDIQNDFLPGGTLAVPNGNEIIPKVNAIQKQYDLVVATQDWHPANHLSFASQHTGQAPFESMDLNGLAQVLWPDHCIQETSGAAFSDQLDTRRVEAIFRKGTERQIDSYSGFFDNGKRKSTGLLGYLKERKIGEIHVCGLAADYCVYFTALDSLQEGFRTSILLDATRAIDEQGFREKRERFVQLGGTVR